MEEKKMLTRGEKIRLLKGETIRVPITRNPKLLPPDVVYHIGNDIEIKKVENFYFITLKRNIIYNM